MVLDGERVVLIKRGRAPSEGKWSIPGGLVGLGEGLEDAAIREVEEECGLSIKIIGLCGVIDRIVRADGTEPIQYHWVIIDYVAAVTGGTLRAGSDAAEARWVPVAELEQYDTTPGLADMIRRGVALYREGGAG